MRDLLERIEARYPRVAERCYEAVAMWLAEEASRLEEGQSLWRSKDDILPGLAQAVRESGVDLMEIACECGVDPIELRRKLALSRLGELLKPREISDLNDQELGTKLQQAAREYGLEIEELLNETSRSSALATEPGATLTVKPKADRNSGSLALSGVPPFAAAAL
jgi:hypothetical protein